MHNFFLLLFTNYIFHITALFYPIEDEQSSILYINVQFLPHDNTV